ncbi:MAG TPA: GrpB family protein [Streptosporangiaceae bacterium]|nr:GrpB family protein [Streptosporangiaceae bacterium]
MAAPLAPDTSGPESAAAVMFMGHPVVVAYLADWPRRAAALIATLREQLGVGAERIEHIGSTAIPGMDAKDVLDVQVSVADLDIAARAFGGPLGGLGFRPTTYDRDHVPVGRDDDPGQWAKRLWVRRDHPDGDVNLHVRRAGSPGERLALLFRDWFRVHPEAVPAYAAFKRSLAAITPDTGVYSDVKDPVVDLVIAVAEAWASSAGWRP